MIEIMSGFPDDVLAISGSGEISEDDYRKVLVPAAREKLRKFKKVRLFFHLGEGFTGYTAGAAWEDAKLGIGNWTGWGRIAVVTDVKWIAQAMRLMAPLFHHPLHVYANAELEIAKRWIVEEEAKAA